MGTAVEGVEESLVGVVDVTNDPTAGMASAAGATALDSARAVADASADVRRILADGVVLAGRTWMPLRAPTFEQQNHRVEMVRRSGVIRLFSRFDAVNDDPDALAGAVLATAFANGVLFDLLAALLVEQGATWTKATAQENAMVFASLTEPDDHARLADAVLWLVLDFFLSVSGSTRIFLKSLILTSAGGNDRASRADRGDASTLPNTTSEATSAATSTSGGGTTSSVPSPDSAAPIR